MHPHFLARGSTEAQVREFAAHHDGQSVEEQAAEIEAAVANEDQTLMVVPTQLVSEIVRFIGRKSAANGSRKRVSKKVTR